MACTKFAVANLKGGCGKSTLALNLAAGLMIRGSTVLLDADPQGTLEHWVRHEGIDGMPPVVTTGSDLVEQLRSLSHRYHALVMDCPPAMDVGSTRVALEMADILLIPVLPSPPDLWSSLLMEEAVQEARKVNPGLRAYFLCNQVEPRSALSHAMRRVLGSCALPTLENTMGRRAAYRWAALEGISVYQFGARGDKAVGDIESIIDEVMRHDKA